MLGLFYVGRVAVGFVLDSGISRSWGPWLLSHLLTEDGLMYGDAVQFYGLLQRVRAVSINRSLCAYSHWIVAVLEADFYAALRKRF